MAATREALLGRFLETAFSASELLMFLREDDATSDLLGYLPSTRPARELVSETVSALVRHNLVDQALFSRLEAARPSWREAIASIQEAWTAGAQIDLAKITPEMPMAARELLAETSNHYRRALALENAIFREIVIQDLHSMAERAQERAEWSFTDNSVSQYERVLVDIYGSAQTSVFSTSIPDYQATWESPLGAGIVKAHLSSRAAVTRVFIFQSKADFTPERRTMIQEHQRSLPDATIKVYIDDDDPFFNFDTNVSRDFTIVDGGEIVALTRSYGRDHLSAVWRFRDSKLAFRLQQYASSLLKGSKFLHECLP